MIETLSHSTLLVFWVQLLAIFVVARVLGSISKALGLSAVVGQLLGGLILGPSLLGEVWPEGYEALFPTEGADVQSAMLLAVSWVSAAFLLATAGFSTDLDLIQRLGRIAALVTAGSIVFPFVGGLLVGYALPETFYGLNEEGAQSSTLVFALFIATTVAGSALAVIAKILSDLNLMRRDVGQITIAAGMANDLFGWVMLGIIAGLASSGSLQAGSIFLTIAQLALFFGVALTIGQRLVDAALRVVRRKGRNVQGALTVTLGAMLLFGVFTQAIGVEAVLGAFVAGIVLSKSRYQQIEGEHVIEDLTSVFFAPMFFATAGLRVDVWALSSDDWGWLAVLLAVAVGLKFAGTVLGAFLGKLTVRETLVLGAGLNARGALEIIVATVGLSVGVFNDKTFTIILMIPLITSLLASLGLRVFGRNLRGSVAERERLAHEEALEANILVRNSRILVPVLNQTNTIVASQICHLAWPDEIGVSVMHNTASIAADTTPIENVLWDRSVDVVSSSKSVVEATLTQSKLGYGVVAVGADYRDTTHGYLSAEIVEILEGVEIPVVIARKATNISGRLPGIFGQALVPIVASPASRAAQELACNMSAALGTNLMMSHVTEPEHHDGFIEIVRDTAVRSNRVAEQTLAQAHIFASGLSANAATEIRFSATPGPEILAHADEIEADLIVIGAQVRHLDDGELSLGPVAEYVLDNANQTVAVVALPDSRPEVSGEG